MNRVVLFVFAGRRANMSIQMPYLLDILDRHPEAELHLWDLTRDEKDQHWLKGYDGFRDGRVQVMGMFHTGHPIRCMNPGSRAGRRFRCSCIRHKPPYERPYRWYAAQFGGTGYTDSTVYVKIDDDVLFLETLRFDDLIAPLADHPNRIISANVANNAVCAKYEDAFANRWEGDPHNSTFDKQWWALHCEPDFARFSHAWFFEEWTQSPKIAYEDPGYVRTRPGEAISINCVAFTHLTMKRLAEAFEHDIRLGDEGVVDQMLPWICQSFHAAHLTFGPQDQKMTHAELDAIRAQYADLTKEYLS